MIKTDHLRAGLAPLQDKTLENALAHRIAKEFPRIGGPRIRKLCAQMILEVISNNLRSADVVRHGQVLWTAVSRDDPPAWGKRIADTDLVPVILDLSTPEDIQARLDRVPHSRRKLLKALRLCHEAYQQGGLLSNFDLSELLNLDDALIGRLIAGHERQTKTVVPRRATLHDVGAGLTHKRIICHKRFIEGKSPELIARETYHSLEAVDRYLGQYDRIRHCRCQGLGPAETAHILDCSLSLVEAYLQIDRELEDKHA
jgi:DNA-binding CsgD family transcriptional regulator